MCQSATLPNATPSETASPTPHTCGCSGHGHTGPAMPAPGENVRWVDAATDMELPAVPFPSRRILEIAGEATLRRVVRQHHRLLRASEIGHLFAPDEATFNTLVERIADYVVEACGGAEAFSQAHGKQCMRTRHFPFSIDESARETWLACLWQALYDTGFPLTVWEEYWQWMEAFSVRMINRRTTKAQPVRISYAEAKTRFDLTTVTAAIGVPPSLLTSA